MTGRRLARVVVGHAGRDPKAPGTRPLTAKAGTNATRPAAAWSATGSRTAIPGTRSDAPAGA